MTRVNIESGGRLKTGDTEPDLVVKLFKDNDNPADLSNGGAEVNFYLAEPSEAELQIDDDTTGNVTIRDASRGEVAYSWQTGDTDTPGTYEGEIEVVDGTDITTYPNRGTFTVYIEEGLK